MVSIVFVYARWGTNEVLSYVDGQLVSTSVMSWLVSPAEVRVQSTEYSLYPTRRRLALCSCAHSSRLSQWTRRFRSARWTMRANCGVVLRLPHTTLTCTCVVLHSRLTSAPLA